MTEAEFKTEKEKAQTIARLESDPSQAAYFEGYMRGVERGWRGAAYGTEDEHRTWMQAGSSDDRLQRSKGRGYRDGLAVGARP